MIGRGRVARGRRDQRTALPTLPPVAVELDAHLGPLYEELLVLHGIEDPDLAADIERGKVEVTMVVRAEVDFAALMQAVAAFRAAVHSLGDVHEDLHSHLVSEDAVSVVAEDRKPIGA